ncbi:MAG TPA: glycosyltransferase [Acidimicrobiales bacterium]|nr:glycosyltransferase [Acidimicrobiales bacterium]
MRVAYVVQGFPVLSQTFVQNELRALAAAGVDTPVFALYPPTGVDPTWVAPFTRLPASGKQPLALVKAALLVARRRPAGLVRMVALAAARPSRFQAHCLGKAVFLTADLIGDRPDRLHAHFARASASVAMLAAAALDLPFSFTAHAADAFGGAFDLDRKLSRADVTVTVCEYNARRLAAERPGLGRVVVIPCGIDLAVFRRSKPYRATPFVVVAIGRLVQKKGFEDLVSAIAILRARGHGVRVRIIGEGPLRETLSAQIAAAGVDDLVTLEGATPPTEVRRALEEASVLCLPCVVAPDGDLDSQPLVVKEAMAMAVPVVGSTEVGMPEMVDASTGRLVPPRSPDLLADALQELAGLAATDPAAVSAMGEAGRAKAARLFDLETLVGRLVKAWRA